LQSDNSRTCTTFLGDVERIFVKKFGDIRELFDLVYTAEETGVCLDTPRMSMWIGADVTRPTEVRPTVKSKKCMFWIDSARSGIDAVVMLQAA
jgi:Asp-tRNA(Asn)/Glu-tRNA(Gln) amidotransferase C subunit